MQRAAFRCTVNSTTGCERRSSRDALRRNAPPVHALAGRSARHLALDDHLDLRAAAQRGVSASDDRFRDICEQRSSGRAGGRATAGPSACRRRVDSALNVRRVAGRRGPARTRARTGHDRLSRRPPGVRRLSVRRMAALRERGGTERRRVARLSSRSAGHPPLREAIAAYVGRARAFSAAPTISSSSADPNKPSISLRAC